MQIAVALTYKPFFASSHKGSALGLQARVEMLAQYCELRGIGFC